MPFDGVLSVGHCLGPGFLIDRILDLSIASAISGRSSPFLSKEAGRLVGELGCQNWPSPWK